MPPEVSLSLLISERTCNCPAGKPLLSAPRGFYIQAMGILGRHATCPLARLDVTKLRPLGLPVIRPKFLTPPIPASNNLMMSSNQASFFLCGCNFNSCGNGLSVGFVASAVHLYLYQSLSSYDRVVGWNNPNTETIHRPVYKSYYIGGTQTSHDGYHMCFSLHRRRQCKVRQARNRVDLCMHAKPIQFLFHIPSQKYSFRCSKKIQFSLFPPNNKQSCQHIKFKYRIQSQSVQYIGAACLELKFHTSMTDTLSVELHSL